MVAEQHRVLVRVAPYLYGLAIVVAGSLALAERRLASPFYTVVLPGALTIALVLRSAYWIRTRLSGTCPGSRRMRRDLGVEIVVVVAQPLERREIFVVIDRGQHFAEPPEFLAAGRIAERMLLRQRQQKIRPAEREIAIACV